MKRILFLAGIAFFLLTATVRAQEPKQPVNPTVDSILSKYSLAPMPTKQLTTEQIFPVIGQYQSNNNSEQKITITLDAQNKGFVWIDGLPQGKVKAFLKRSPGTYKIPVQKTAEGKDVPEGTLVYDKDSRVINILLGRAFNDEDPASVFNTPAAADEQATVVITKTKAGKTKQKVKKAEPWVFTGTKLEQATAANHP